MPASRLHPFARLVLCGVALLAVVLVVQSVGVGLLLAFSAALGLSKLPLDQRIMQIATNYGLHLTVMSYPLGVGILYLFRTRVDKYSWRSLGFSRGRALPDMVRGALTALLTLSVLFSLMWVAGAVRFGGWSNDVQTHSGLYALGSLLAFGLAFGAVGLFEETVFRGYGLANLRQCVGWPGAVIIQAAVFAVIHLGNGIGNPDVFRAALAGLPSLFLIAVFFALAYRKTGSLWFPIGFHIAWDWLLGCVFSLPVSGIPTFRLFDVQETGTSFLSGGRFGAESSFFLIPLVLAMVFALWLAPDHPRAVANLDHPEPQDAAREAANSFPMGAPLSTPTSYAVAPEVEEEKRENRYSARFGSATGFDSEMLRELKQMNEAREQAEREKAETERAARRAEEMRREEIRRAQIEAQAFAVSEPKDAATVTEEVQEPAAVESAVREAVVESEAAPSLPVSVAVPEAPSTPREVVAPAAPAPIAPRTPVAPTAPVAPAPTVTKPQESEPTRTAPPQEAPPKKARPRW